MAVRTDPFRINLIDATSFAKAMAEWPLLPQERVSQVLVTAARLAKERIVQRTPVLTGRARASWQIVGLDSGAMAGGAGIGAEVGSLAVGVVSALPYIRRLEVGWGARRLGVKKGRRAAVARLTIAGRKMPIGGYRMIREVYENEMWGIIQKAARQVMELYRTSNLARKAA